MSGAGVSIPADALELQARASDPEASVWVSANAGSGKTFVLAQRVIRLLLRGVDPSQILCLTYTKAAAAHMANQIFRRLREWVRLEDAELACQLEQMDHRIPDQAMLDQARRLFSETLETPGGLKVETIHAFCTRLLQQFPFEAGVTAGFEVLDEHGARTALAQCHAEVLRTAQDNPEGILAQALSQLVALVHDSTLTEVLEQAMSGVRRQGAPQMAAEPPQIRRERLAKALDISPTLTPQSIVSEIMKGGALPRAQWLEVANALLQGEKSTDQEQAQRFLKAVEGDTESYLSIFLSKDRTPRTDRYLTKDFRTDHPEWAAALDGEKARVVILYQALGKARILERTCALLAVAEAIQRCYEQYKRRMGVLDFEDLTHHALALLEKDQAQWVRYKLDHRITHILVDEAQDTSPQQWQIITRLAEEFFAGQGTDIGQKRTLFAVGDAKQSIYSFQGADPVKFARMGRSFSRQAREASLEFHHVELKKSFRSATRILEAVDQVFRSAKAHAGLSGEQAEATVHEAIRRDRPGTVDLWPLVEPPQRPEMEAWDAPFDLTAQDDPAEVLGQRMAATIRLWLQERRCQPRDILILVRQRGPVFEAVIRALQRQAVPVAGADRLWLMQNIAVMDLVALGDALLQTHDDLQLASVLKSPLVGMSEEELFAIAHHREGPLWETMPQPVRECLMRWRHQALNLPPFEFYASVLLHETKRGETVRQQVLRRLGQETQDALDEFLSLALEFDARAPATLQAFLAWLRGSDIEIRRDMDPSRNEVRVMTVHGAKGLEAPIVFLADTTAKPEGQKAPALLQIEEGAAVWVGAQKLDTLETGEARGQARRLAAEEYRRLLYVALTRAADHLIICGRDHGGSHRPADCWYDLIHEALSGDAIEIPAEGFAGTVLRWRQAEETSTVQPAEVEGEEPPPAMPEWMWREPEGHTTEPHRLSPSGPRQPVASTGAADRRRGTVIHRLLEALPDIPPDQRLQATRTFLDSQASDMTQPQRQQMMEEVLHLLDHPELASLLSCPGRAEVPVAGTVTLASGRTYDVPGRIDRLCIAPDRIVVIDYKSGSPPPEGAENVPKRYLHQLALYAALLRQLWPDRRVEAVLIWTEHPRLVSVPAAHLEELLSEMA